MLDPNIVDFAEGFLKTDLIEKMGDLRYSHGDNDQSLSLYIKAFKDAPEEELLDTKSDSAYPHTMEKTY